MSSWLRSHGIDFLEKHGSCPECGERALKVSVKGGFAEIRCVDGSSWMYPAAYLTRLGRLSVGAEFFAAARKRGTDVPVPG